MAPVNARDIVVEVESAVTDTWVAISGIIDKTLDLGANEEVADTTTNDSDGNYEQDVMQRGATLEITGLRTATAGVQDTGQLRCETLAGLVGASSRGRVRYHYPSETLWKVWSATVSLTGQDGGNNDKMNWGAKFTRCGAATTSAVA